jgi:L-rhamnose mutarotase
MTKEEAIKNHKILWQGIITYLRKYGCNDNATYIKRKTFVKIFDYNMDILHYCFLCELYNNTDVRRYKCKCPIRKNNENRCSLWYDFYEAVEAKNKDLAIELAIDIKLAV